MIALPNELTHIKHMKMHFSVTMLALLCSTIPGQSQTTSWVTPTNATASGYTVWAGSPNTGPAPLAIDANSLTSWTLNGMGFIDFDLGSTNIVRGIQVNIIGHVSNGNMGNIYVDGFKVLTTTNFAATYYFPGIRGRFIRYETLALPNPSGQTATWSEVSEFKAFIQTALASPTIAISRAVQVRWLTESAVIYQPQISSDSNTWQDYGPTVLGDGTEKNFSYVTDTPDSLFFRVQAR